MFSSRFLEKKTDEPRPATLKSEAIHGDSGTIP